MSDELVLIDDEEEYEESGKGNRFLGFMFGNVDNSGDLDVDYLDEVILCGFDVTCEVGGRNVWRMKIELMHAYMLCLDCLSSFQLFIIFHDSYAHHK